MTNEPGKPIVTRREGARFYCAVCGGAYSADTNKGFAAGDLVRLCKCAVYVSADTLPKPKSGTPNSKNGADTRPPWTCKACGSKNYGQAWYCPKCNTSTAT